MRRGKFLRESFTGLEKEDCALSSRLGRNLSIRKEWGWKAKYSELPSNWYIVAEMEAAIKISSY